VCAVDFSAKALTVARANARQLGAPVCVWRGDWLEALVDRGIDLLMSNPPYLAADDRHLPGPLASGEPKVALVAEAEGLAHYRALARQGPQCCVPRPGCWSNTAWVRVRQCARS
jgi:release factor glutamine methyltransferase